MSAARRAIGVATLSLGTTIDLAARAGGDAAAHPPVALTLDACGDLSEAEVQRIVGVELGAPLVPAAAPSRPTTRITARCGGGAITITVDDAITRKSLHRSLGLEAIPAAARARLIALSIAELLSVSWSELDSDPTPPIEPEGPRSSVAEIHAARAVARERARRASPSHFTASAFLGVELFTAHPTELWILGARLGWSSASSLSLHVDLAGGHGSTTTTLGDIGVDTWSATGSVLLRRERAAWTLYVGGGLRVGVARITGHPSAPELTRGHTITGGWGGPLFAGSLTYSPQTPLLIGLAAEAGYAVIPVRALVGGEPSTGVAGVFLGAVLSAGARF